MTATGICRIGDVVANGSVLASGCLTVTAGGIPVTRLGDVDSFGMPVASGSAKPPTVFAGGLPVARMGDVDSAGGILASGQLNVIVG